MPPEPTPESVAPIDVEMLTHTLLTALTVAKGRTQLTRRLAAGPNGIDPARLDAALAAIDRALTQAAVDLTEALHLLRTHLTGRITRSETGDSGRTDQVLDDPK